MNLHLVEIAAIVAPGAHAVLLVDQAGWHMSARLVVPSNITIVALPPKSPELNLVENIWQYMRDNWLSNRIFKSYDDLVDHCCEAWNKLVDQPWRIMSIGLRQWAHGTDFEPGTLLAAFLLDDRVNAMRRAVAVGFGRHDQFFRY